MKDFTHEFRISVAGLATGMYVARLDRPWLGTSFPLEGFKVHSEDDLAKIRRICHFIYVDVTRGIAPDPRFVEFEPSDLLQRASGHDAIADLQKTQWKVSNSFDIELPQAEKARASLELGIAEVMHDLHNGRELVLQKLQDGVETMVDSITRNPAAFIWLKAIKRMDNYAYQHALGCSVWAAGFGRQLGMNREELGELALTGLLFDVGKTRVASDLLAKTAKFDEFDHERMREHVQHSIDILKKTQDLPPRILEAVATHHERHDGSGYPNGLRGSEIPIFGRIIGLIDSYDAMTNIRPYADSRSPHGAVMELYQARDVLFQTELVEQFIQTCGIYPTGSLVELSDGRVGVVTAVHSLKRLRPSVMLLLDADKKPLPEFSSIDLSWVREDPDGQLLNVKRGLPQGAFGIDTAALFLD